MNRRLAFVLACMALLSPTILASPVITLPEVVALFPDYVNHEQQSGTGFQTPCVDAFGTLTLHVNVNSILGTVTEPIAIAMVCQMVDYPPFMAGGLVTFSDPDIQYLSHDTVPGHPDAFQIEYIVPLGTTPFDIFIHDTGWPEGCLTGILDWAAWDLISVAGDQSSFSQVKSLFQ